jgi:hypothetical protein
MSTVCHPSLFDCIPPTNDSEQETRSAATLSRSDLIRLLDDQRSDTMLAWLKAHVPPYGVGQPIPCLPPTLYTTSRVGREIKLMRGPANKRFKPNGDNQAQFVIYGRVDSLGTRWKALDSVFERKKPVKNISSPRTKVRSNESHRLNPDF